MAAGCCRAANTSKSADATAAPTKTRCQRNGFSFCPFDSTDISCSAASPTDTFRGADAMARRAIPIEELRAKEHTHFIKAVNEGGPFVCALVATAFLENMLMTLLTNFFVDRPSSTADGMFKPGGVLGDLTKTAGLAYCLGFINKPMLNNIEKIANIRNTFAHSHEIIDFDHPKLEEPLSALTFPVLTQQIPPGEENPFEAIAPVGRRKFSLIALQLYTWISFAAQTVEHQKNTAPDQIWPDKPGS
jgi:DNA-binding MltR family transcriptional regulator